MSQASSSRLVASRALLYISTRGESMEKAMMSARSAELEDSRDIAFARALVYGTLRWYHRLDAVLAILLSKPLAAKHADIRCLLLVALHQLSNTDIAAHAVVSESVNTVVRLRKAWARGLVNGVLRNYQRRHEEITSRLQDNPVAQTSHPQWLLELLRQAWPDDWVAITRENNHQAPMSLRVNTRQGSRDQYLQALEAAGISAVASPVSQTGLTLDRAQSVEKLPGFAEGRASVQDIAAQLAADILDLAPGMNILDACAAPGGKTAHLLEYGAEDTRLTAIDIDTQRAERIKDTLARIGLQASIIVADATRPDQWWNSTLFDRILLDAPCSGTGVIRRHPDIKLLRRREDISAYTALQMRLLNSLWPLLKPGGLLLYATCSVLPQENSRLVSDFLSRNADAQVHSIKVNCGRKCDVGIQIFPGENNMDGFFYACLAKT